jgi:hypothetical protein
VVVVAVVPAMQAQAALAQMVFQLLDKMLILLLVHTLGLLQML